MKTLKEFEALGISKRQILWYARIDFREGVDLKVDDVLSLILDNELTGVLLNNARWLQRVKQPEQHKCGVGSHTKQVQTRREANLHRFAEALVAAGYLSENPVRPPRRSRRRTH